jgi:hypothetical protein
VKCLPPFDSTTHETVHDAIDKDKPTNVPAGCEVSSTKRVETVAAARCRTICLQAMFAISLGTVPPAGTELHLTSSQRSGLLIVVVHAVVNTAESKQKEGRFESDALRNKR